MPDRRLFLVQLLAAAVGCTSREPEARAPGKPEWKLAIGLSSFGSSERLFRKHYDLDEILAFAQRERFQGVELSPEYRAAWPDASDDAAIRTIRGKVEAYGLKVFAIEAAVPDADLLAEDAAARARYTEALNGQIGMAKKLGCDCVGLRPPPLKAMGELPEDEMIGRLAGGLRPAVERAAAEGLILALEGEPGTVIDSGARYSKLIDAVSSDRFKVIFNPSHFDVISGGSRQPERLLEEIGVSRVGYVHLTDGDGTIREEPAGARGTSRHLPLGEGKYDSYTLLKMLYDGGFSGWLMMDGYETEDAYYAARAGRDIVEATLTALAPASPPT